MICCLSVFDGRGLSCWGFLLGGKVLFVVDMVLLVVLLGDWGCLVVFCCVLTLPLFDFDVCPNRFLSSLQKSVLQRQAKMDPEPSSVISLVEQSGNGTRGSCIEPSSTRVGKHSRNVAER